MLGFKVCGLRMASCRGSFSHILECSVVDVSEMKLFSRLPSYPSRSCSERKKSILLFIVSGSDPRQKNTTWHTPSGIFGGFRNLQARIFGKNCIQPFKDPRYNKDSSRNQTTANPKGYSLGWEEWICFFGFGNKHFGSNLGVPSWG